MKKIMALLLALCLVTASFAGCQGKTGSKDKLNIVTSIFPIYDWTREITKDIDGVKVNMLVKNGTDLHSYQPSAADLVTIAECDVFIYVGGESDDWATDTIKNYAKKECVVINLLEVLGDLAKVEEAVEGMEGAGESGEYDEHVWLSLINAKLFVKNIAAALEKKDSANAEKYKDNSEAYLKKLEALDSEYINAVNSSTVNTLLFADRFPFRYLTDDYGIVYYAAFLGCSAESEASFQTILFLADKINTLGLSTVLVIDGSDSKLAKTVINSTEAKSASILTLDSMQSVSTIDVRNGATYIGIMQKNLEVLKKALKSSAVPTPTESATAVPTVSVTLAPTVTDKPITTNTPVPTATERPVATNTPVPTAIATVTDYPAPSATDIPELTPVLSPTDVPSTTPGVVPTPTEIPAPTGTAIPTPTNAETPSATDTPALTPTGTPLPSLTGTPTSIPVNTPTSTPTSTPTNTPISTPTNTPTSTPTNTPTPTAPAVNFTDSKLETAVKKALGKSGKLTQADVKNVTELDLRGLSASEQITSLKGLEAFTSLKVLHIDSNKVSDLSPLAGLTSLEVLTADYNEIKDISALSKLTGLKVLSLCENRITDISSLSSLKSLTELDLSYNSLNSINALSGLTGLRILRLTGTGISSVTALSSIAGNLDSLWLAFNRITSISSLSGMKKSATLVLTGNNIADWSPVSHITSVTGRP